MRLIGTVGAVTMGIFKRSKKPEAVPFITDAQAGYIISLMSELNIDPIDLQFNNAVVSITRRGVNLIVTRNGAPYSLSRGEASRVITALLERRGK
jgi:hypothetical protein